MPNVLVVDDHRDTAESLALLLGLEGHDVRAVTSGFAAFSALADFTPDVCVLDIKMPLMDGFAVAVRLREALGPNVRLLALSVEENVGANPRAGVFDAVFTKPPDLRELFAAVAGPPA
jgi:CheY-like chemotaxis protein